MKKSLQIFVFSSVLILTGLVFYGFNLIYPDGPPAGKTGSPGDGSNCTECHGGTATPVMNWLTSDIPVSGYIPGNTYTFTVTNPGSGNKGFQVSPQDATGNLIGSLMAGPGTKLAGGGKYVEHSSAKSMDPATWTFDWTAPAMGVGDVAFYAAFVTGKPNVSVESVTYKENTTGSITSNTINDLSIYPNPVKDRINFSFYLSEPNRVSINLISLTGQRAATFMDHKKLSGQVDLDFNIPESVPKGIYLLEIKYGSKYIVEKLRIQ